MNSGIPQKKLAGAVIISPSLYVETPASGTEAQFLPIAQTSNLNILLIIPKKSTAYLRVTELQNILSTSGNTIYVQILPEIRDRFFFREDATDIEQQAAAELDQKIISGMQLLQKTPAAIQTQVTLPLPVMASTSSLSTTGNLLPFKGNWIPEAFSLSDMNDVTHSLDQYTGKVVLINFWASWCPPCIHEIPSMTKLQDTFGSNLISILAINLGEEKGSIETFLAHHPVNFTVLLDPGQSQPKRWKVFAFPTSYLLDKEGIIRYTVAGAIDWDSIDVKQKVSELLVQ